MGQHPAQTVQICSSPPVLAASDSFGALAPHIALIALSTSLTMQQSRPEPFLLGLKLFGFVFLENHCKLQGTEYQMN